MPKVVGIDPKYIKRVSCTKCGSINEYTESEVKVLWSGTDYAGGADGAEGFNCAGCGKEIYIRRW